MSKLRKLVKALSLILRQPSLLNKIVDDADVNKREVTGTYALPDGLPVIDLCALLPGFSENVDPSVTSTAAPCRSTSRC